MDTTRDRRQIVVRRKEAVKLLEYVVAVRAEIWAEDDFRRQLSNGLLQRCYERLESTSSADFGASVLEEET
jgi:hypothetical protein